MHPTIAGSKDWLHGLPLNRWSSHTQPRRWRDLQQDRNPDPGNPRAKTFSNHPWLAAALRHILNERGMRVRDQSPANGDTQGHC